MNMHAILKALPLDGGDEQVAMSAGHGFGSRGDPNLLMGGGGVFGSTPPFDMLHPTPALPIKGRGKK